MRRPRRGSGRVVRHDQGRRTHPDVRRASPPSTTSASSCQPGRVTGFLGPNGAGKTTTMRVMVGLTPADPRAGSRSAATSTSDIPNPGRHVGVLLDASAQHAGRTGREILDARRPDDGAADVARRRDARAGLARRDARPSAGCATTRSACKQRLGIAHALLGDPSVLILDEPANGLDPAGIRWMRGLLKGYADRGGTVLLSSHLLNEVEQIADEMILIGHGRIVAQGDKKTLLADADRHRSTFVTALDNEALATALTGQGLHRRTRPARASGSRPSRSRSAASPPSTQIVLTDLRSGRRRPRGPVPRAHRRHPARRPRGTRCRHEHRPSAPHDPRRLADPAGPVRPPGPGRAAQARRHPRRPLAADLDRRAHAAWC